MPLQMEFDGKDVESAVEKASKKLNIPVAKLKYGVISYGSTGIFGLVGARKARIRVNMPGSAPRKAKKAKSGADPEPVQAAPLPESLEALEGPLETEPPADSAESTVLPQVENGIEETARTVDEAALQAGRDALQRIVDAISGDAAISVDTTPECILFNISAENSAVLIGKRGQTLDAMQYVVEKIVNLRNNERIRVQVDVEGYLQNRKDNLKKMAGRMAEKVKRTGKPASAGQMNAHDRRIIHMALKDDDGVRTQSIGEGLYRKLMIFPKKNTQKKKPS